MMLGVCRGRSCPGLVSAAPGGTSICEAGFSYPWGSSSIMITLVLVWTPQIPVAQLGTQKYLTSLCWFGFSKELVTDIQREYGVRPLRPIPSPPSGIPKRLNLACILPGHTFYSDPWYGPRGRAACIAVCKVSQAVCVLDPTQILIEYSEVGMLSPEPHMPINIYVWFLMVGRSKTNLCLICAEFL